MNQDAVLCRKVAAADGVELHYEVLGSDAPGAPVLVLANGLGGRLYAWEPLVEHFAPTHRILTWDYRGLFNSGSPPTIKGLQLPNHASDILTILDEEQIERAHFVGWSMGTMVNLEVALSAPRRVQSLTLINGSYGQIFDRALQPWMRLPGIPRVLHRVVETLASHEWIADRIGALTLNPLHISAVGYMISKAWGNPKIRPMYAQYVSDVFGESFHNYLRLFQALDAHSSYYLLPEVTQPTLVISGGLDWLTPASMSRRIARRIPGAEHLHLPLASHFALLEYSDEVVERMQAFLQPLRVHAGGSNTAAA
ncbi:MAG: alpha/beta fold hydrolase [Planctomycetes bacterium]|nr:alpha/beta fold hydrolase [Planctomycetota bacterium]